MACDNTILRSCAKVANQLDSEETKIHTFNKMLLVFSAFDCFLETLSKNKE